MKKEKALWLKWLFCVIPALLAAAMYFLLPHFPHFTEYAVIRGLFKAVSLPLQWVVSWLPFSLTEAAVVLAVPAVAALAAVWIISIIKSKRRILTAEKGIRFLAWCVSLALLVFMVMDGAAFSRLSVGELMGLPNEKYTAEQLYAVTCDLAKKASAARERLPEDENGNVKLSVSQNELLKLADDCYKPLQKEYPFLKSGVRRVKPVALSHLWSYTGFTGVYCPWLSEASVNVDVPDYEIGHTATHELAHTMGFAKENECNFLGFLACAASGQPDYEYSGYQQAYVYCANALYKADKQLWKKAFSNCSKGMVKDLQNSNTYWKSFEGEIKEASQDFNDSFIKANGVESGTLSYSEMVGLMLRYYDSKELI